jgi:hypothetical protein
MCKTCSLYGRILSAQSPAGMSWNGGYLHRGLIETGAYIVPYTEKAAVVVRCWDLRYDIQISFSEH